MKHHNLCIILIFALLFAGCRREAILSATETAVSTTSPTPISAENGTRATAVPPTSQPADNPTVTPSPEQPQVVHPIPPSSLTILYTNDEHGWMEGITPDQGAAQLMGLWHTEAEYDPDGDFLLLSGGDMWTGPAISTWFDGESMVEVMNSMGYAAAAVGNHEFDFGLDVLQLRADQANFPFLSANIRTKADGTIPTNIGIEPYTLVTVNDIDVGIIGLTTQLTPQTTNPINIVDFEFIDYETALREIVPEVKEAGAELIVVPAHICQAELNRLAETAVDLGIHMLGGGHCNELFADEVAGVVLLEGGSSMSSYAFAEFAVDSVTGEVTAVDYGTRTNTGGEPDPEIETIVAEWQAATSDELAVVIGYSEKGLDRRSEAMQQLITESWLWAYPTADVAITNLGGMRAPLPPGDIELADIITIMPFNNVIIELTVTGDDLLRILARSVGDAIGGVHQVGTAWVLSNSGVAIEPDTTYNLLVNDFMYAGGDDYTILAEADPNAYDTGIDWRQPVIDWLVNQGSTVDNPIDDAIATLGQ
ncbi:MAG: 5'-nucleotidase C-terminal domain-containing protein [Anaerolineales bacterium]|nr:5'-nucleotidase C-terminal domain-containing protein [Anaerolineales bacterium]